MAVALARGFDDPVHDTQRAFRCVMDALARPGTIQPLVADMVPPAPLTAELAAIALALADHEAPLWLDAPLARSPAVAAYLRFHTGAAMVADPLEAAFALVSDPAACPPFAGFALGTPDYPDRSTTLVLAVAELASGHGLLLEGPGIPDRARLHAAPLPADITARLAANRALFPRGIDCLLVAPARVAGLPRSTRIVTETDPCM